MSMSCTRGSQLSESGKRYATAEWLLILEQYTCCLCIKSHSVHFRHFYDIVKSVMEIVYTSSNQWPDLKDLKDVFKNVVNK